MGRRLHSEHPFEGPAEAGGVGKAGGRDLLGLRWCGIRAWVLMNWPPAASRWSLGDTRSCRGRCRQLPCTRPPKRVAEEDCRGVRSGDDPFGVAHSYHSSGRLDHPRSKASRTAATPLWRMWPNTHVIAGSITLFFYAVEVLVVVRSWYRSNASLGPGLSQLCLSGSGRCQDRNQARPALLTSSLDARFMRSSGSARPSSSSAFRPMSSNPQLR